MMKTEKIIIFIDTCIFVSENFFQGNNLKTIYIHSKKGLCELKITDIVAREVLKQIQIKTKESFLKLKETKNNLKKGIRILRNVPEYNSLISSMDLKEEETINKLKERFNNDLTDNKIEVIDTSSCACGKIFDDYFEVKPPFGKADKKSEFPDAFNFEVIRQWAEANEQKVLFVTKDKDFEKMPSSLVDISFSELSNVSEHILKINNKNHINFLHTKFNKEQSYFKKFIITDIDIEEISSTFYDYLSDQSNIDEIELKEPTDVRVSLNDMSVTYLKLNETCILEIRSNIYFNIYAEYNDYDTGFYDKEDGVWYFVESESHEYHVEAEAIFQIDCDYNFTKGTINPMKLEDCKIYITDVS